MNSAFYGFIFLIFLFTKIVFLHFSLQGPSGNLEEVRCLASIPQGFMQTVLNQSAFQIIKGAA